MHVPSWLYRRHDRRRRRRGQCLLLVSCCWSIWLFVVLLMQIPRWEPLNSWKGYICISAPHSARYNRKFNTRYDKYVADPVAQVPRGEDEKTTQAPYRYPRWVAAKNQRSFPGPVKSTLSRKIVEGGRGFLKNSLTERQFSFLEKFKNYLQPSTKFQIHRKKPPGHAVQSMSKRHIIVR